MEDKTSQRLDTIAKELDRRRQQHGSGSKKGRTIRRVLRKILMLVALIFFALSGIFIFNFLRLNSDLVEGHIKQGIIPNLTQGKFDLDIGSVSGNLIHGVELENVLVKNPHFKNSPTVMTVPKISLQYSLLNIFWGSITLEKLLIENPVLTLKRNEDGRGIWDFSVPDAEQLSVEEKKKLTDWQKQEQAQSLADNYLTDISVKNLSVLIPAPDQLIVDEFLARLTKFPEKTRQFTGINLNLKKYPADKFVTHIFSVAVPKNPDFLRFQFTRTKSTGNFTLSFDALGQNFNLAVENLGLDGRKVNIYDGRMKDRLNLEFQLARGRMSLMDKVRGLHGVLKVPDLKGIFEGLLSSDNKIAGSFNVEFNTDPGKNLYDSKLDLKINDFTLAIPFVPEIKKLTTSVSASDRVAEVKRFVLEMNKIQSRHKGVLDYSDDGHIKANIESEIMEETLEAHASYIRQNPGLHKLVFDLTRNSGEAHIELNRQRIGKNITYRDFIVKAGLVENGKAVEILPLNLMPRQISNDILAWFERIDLVGPLKAETRFETIDDWKGARLDIYFADAKIINKNNPEDTVMLAGKAVFADGNFSLDGFKAYIDNFSIGLNGEANLATSGAELKSYNFNANGMTTGNKSFKITSERLQKSLGLKYRPDFDSIEIKGSKLLTASISSHSDANKATLNIETMRFLRRKKPLWFDSLKAEINSGKFNLAKKELPGPVNATIEGKLFGIDLNADLVADIAGQQIQKLNLKGQGANFSKIIEAIVSQPEGEAFFKKYPMNIGGSFNFAFLGEGLLKEPQLEGWIKFPRLSFSYDDVQAKLPFHILVKTVEQSYQGSVEAGKAFIKVGPVNFNLGNTKAEVSAERLFIAKDPEVTFNLNSKVFGADIKSDGSLKLNSKKIESMNLTLNSNKIEELAGEIARIGEFKVPFKLAGRFKADASLSGNISSPNSTGNLELANISLKFPLHDFGKDQVLEARNFAGKASFSKKGPDYFSIDVKNFTGKLLDAIVKLRGKAHLTRKPEGFKPFIDKLEVDLEKMGAKTLADYLVNDFLPADVARQLAIESGEVFGKFSLSGSPNKLVAIGEAVLSGVSLRYQALKESFTNFSGRLKFEGRSDSAYARIAIEDASAGFGRSIFSIKRGYLEDPLRSGKIMLEGKVEKIYPTDLIAMMGGMEIPALSFPKEGWLDGSLKLEGTMFTPEISSRVTSSEMTLAYDSGENIFSVPIGENLIDFTYNPGSGRFNLTKASLRLLGGEILIDEGTAVLTKQRPFSFNMNGKIDGLDIGKLKISDQKSFRGVISGQLKAFWDENNTRDAVFNLDFKNIFVPKIPLVDPASINETGVEFLAQPDFRTGQLNFYVTSQEDAELAGRLLIADGLFAGPHMRLELGNSEFNPFSLKLNGKLMLNPQSLRKTTLGRKLRKFSAAIQDKKTGIPYVDLNLVGTWDKPELMARKIQKDAENRGKRNFVRKIFGSRGPHKASVEELMQWFPGWQKGM